MIKAHNLAKTFGQHRAVQGLSFQAPDGAITGLLGANGAGKTTTLRMICGVLKPESGEICINDSNANVDSLSRQRDVGALLDHIGIYTRLTARENLTYFGELRGIAPSVLKKRVNEVLSKLGLEAVADRRALGFSQGERMKIALGRALLHAPQNLLLDEPTNGLDIPTVRSLRELLKSLRDAGNCVVLSTHVLEEVRALCDRIVVVAGGRVVAEGTAVELCSRTSTASLEEAFIQLTSTTGVC